MKIPRIPSPDGISGKAWNDGGNGKGSRPRNNDSESFRENYDSIFGDTERRSGHTRVYFDKDGKKVEIHN